MTICAAATPRATPGAEMSLAYTTELFSAPHCPVMAFRTARGLILYGAVQQGRPVRHRAVFTRRDDSEARVRRKGSGAHGDITWATGPGKHGISIIPESAAPLFRYVHVFNHRRPSLHHQCICTLAGIRFNEATWACRATAMSFGRLG